MVGSKGKSSVHYIGSSLDERRVWEAAEPCLYPCQKLATGNLSREATEGGYERRKTLHIPSEDDSQQKIMVFQAVK